MGLNRLVVIKHLTNIIQTSYIVLNILVTEVYILEERKSDMFPYDLLQA